MPYLPLLILEPFVTNCCAIGTIQILEEVFPFVTVADDVTVEPRNRCDLRQADVIIYVPPNSSASFVDEELLAVIFPVFYD